jgi:hypothetical protein
MSLRVIWQSMDRSVTKKILYGPKLLWTGPSPNKYYMDLSFGPYNISLVTDRSIYCHMTLSAMNYLLYIQYFNIIIIKFAKLFFFLNFTMDHEQIWNKRPISIILDLNKNKSNQISMHTLFSNYLHCNNFKLKWPNYLLIDNRIIYVMFQYSLDIVYRMTFERVYSNWMAFNYSKDYVYGSNDTIFIVSAGIYIVYISVSVSVFIRRRIPAGLWNDGGESAISRIWGCYM